MEATWNSYVLEVTYTVLGWIAFILWSCSLYPQVFLNYFRKSVVGLNFNYLLLNNTKHTLYLIYNTALYFSPVVRFQYHIKYGFDQMIPVAANDVAFSTHCVLLTAVLLFQVAIYERGDQSISKITIGIITTVWITVAVCCFIAFPSKSWLWLISIFNIMQVIIAVVKYIPQAVMNFKRKSTCGFSIGNILLDFCGGVTNYAQMVTQSIDQNSWVNFSGNIGKVLLSLEICNLGKPQSDLNEEIHYDTSLSVTADYDPELVGSITPAKRLSAETHLDVMYGQDMASAQLSSTKMTKHIKTE